MSPASRRFFRPLADSTSDSAMVRTIPACWQSTRKLGRNTIWPSTHVGDLPKIVASSQSRSEVTVVEIRSSAHRLRGGMITIKMVIAASVVDEGCEDVIVINSRLHQDLVRLVLAHTNVWRVGTAQTPHSCICRPCETITASDHALHAFNASCGPQNRR